MRVTCRWFREALSRSLSDKRIVVRKVIVPVAVSGGEEMLERRTIGVRCHE
jgi:hypothetical protein